MEFRLNAVRWNAWMQTLNDLDQILPLVESLYSLELQRLQIEVNRLRQRNQPGVTATAVVKSSHHRQPMLPKRTVIIEMQ
ncbi:MAG: hypothetical protein JNL58_00760 [Planctomyces sp.]|nr:hypothetical protein [Planctomyces sp.]